MPTSHGRRGFALGSGAQSDGRRNLLHVLTAVVSIAVSLGVANVTNVFQGPTGQPGQTKIITKAGEGYGICFRYDSSKTGSARFQFTPPVQDAAGSYCKSGHLISVVPGRP